MCWKEEYSHPGWTYFTTSFDYKQPNYHIPYISRKLPVKDVHILTGWSADGDYIPEWLERNMCTKIFTGDGHT